MTLSLIVATTLNNVIGKDNQMPWHLPADLAWFRRNTTGKPVIMGRKTFESIGRPLPNRKNIVLSKNGDKESFEQKGIKLYQNLENLIADYKNSEEEIFIIGGEQIYREFMQKGLVRRLYISYIEFSDSEADAYFPEIDYNSWKIIKEKNYDNWKFCMYEKE